MKPNFCADLLRIVLWTIAIVCFLSALAWLVAFMSGSSTAPPILFWCLAVGGLASIVTAEIIALLGGIYDLLDYILRDKIVDDLRAIRKSLKQPKQG